MQATQIAALDARTSRPASSAAEAQSGATDAARNERQVRSEGALLGERRAAIARIVMIALFGIAAALRPGPSDRAQMIAGAVFSLYAMVLAIGVWRVTAARPRRSMWFSIVTTVLDFVGTGVLGGLDLRFTGILGSGEHAISSAILLGFAVARASVWYVAFSVVCAELSYVVLAGYAGSLGGRTTLFVMSGYVVLGIVLALTNRAIGAMLQGLRRRDNLTRFLPRAVAERILAEGPTALAPVELEVTVLFSDIRGFTAMSERMGPREVLAMLDDYFARMSRVVKAHDGVVGKFLGDGMLAFWGVPDRIGDHASRAVKAARDMRRVVAELNQARADDGLVPIKIGIGIHTGTVAAGMLGGELQAEYTIIGDAVNVASRIEGLTKEHAVDVLISETTHAQVAPGLTQRIAEAAIRGRVEPVVLYTVGD